MIEILEDIWQVGGGTLTGPGDAAIYLVKFGDQAALIDAGCGFGHDRLVREISRCLLDSVPIAYLFLTHCHFDHCGGAEKVRAQYGCKIVAHELDAAFLESGDSEVTAARWYGAFIAPLRIDYKVTSTQEMFRFPTGEIQAWHCPGHSPGSMVYLTERAGKKVLFGQDIHGPLHENLRSNREEYLESLRLLLGLEADILCEGHFGVYEGKEEVRDFIESFL